LQRQLALANRELAMNRPLLESGDISRSEIMRLERQQADIGAQIANVRNKYYQDLQTDNARVNEDMVSAREVLTQRRASLEEGAFFAPMDGIVKNVHLTTLGGVLRPGEEVLQIVPTGQELIVEAKVAPSDRYADRAGAGCGQWHRSGLLSGACAGRYAQNGASSRREHRDPAGHDRHGRD
jgi:adhesin transport system membrane fusion protein